MMPIMIWAALFTKPAIAFLQCQSGCHLYGQPILIGQVSDAPILIGSPVELSKVQK